MDRRFMYRVKKMSPGGCLLLSRGYIDAYDNNFQETA